MVDVYASFERAVPLRNLPHEYRALHFVHGTKSLKVELIFLVKTKAGRS